MRRLLILVLSTGMLSVVATLARIDGDDLRPVEFGGWEAWSPLDADGTGVTMAGGATAQAPGRSDIATLESHAVTPVSSIDLRWGAAVGGAGIVLATGLGVALALHRRTKPR
ncbi:MAG: hypothetical protein R3246_15285 [Acidimicrobiia bacterium]|nr:hypothetical protein [Acidimicrobiia bacterium]